MSVKSYSFHKDSKMDRDIWLKLNIRTKFSNPDISNKFDFDPKTSSTVIMSIDMIFAVDLFIFQYSYMSYMIKKWKKIPMA